VTARALLFTAEEFLPSCVHSLRPFAEPYIYIWGQCLLCVLLLVLTSHSATAYFTKKIAFPSVLILYQTSNATKETAALMLGHRHELYMMLTARTSCSFCIVLLAPLDRHLGGSAVTQAHFFAILPHADMLLAVENGTTLVRGLHGWAFNLEPKCIRHSVSSDRTHLPRWRMLYLSLIKCDWLLLQ
jgi:hypothetical protein